MFNRVWNHYFHHPFWGFAPYFWKHPFTPPGKLTARDGIQQLMTWVDVFFYVLFLFQGDFFSGSTCEFSGEDIYSNACSQLVFEVGVYLSKLLTKISSPSKLPVPFGSKQKLVGQIGSIIGSLLKNLYKDPY